MPSANDGYGGGASSGRQERTYNNSSSSSSSGAAPLANGFEMAQNRSAYNSRADSRAGTPAGGEGTNRAHSRADTNSSTYSNPQEHPANGVVAGSTTSSGLNRRSHRGSIDHTFGSSPTGQSSTMGYSTNQDSTNPNATAQDSAQSPAFVRPDHSIRPMASSVAVLGGAGQGSSNLSSQSPQPPLPNGAGEAPSPARRSSAFALPSKYPTPTSSYSSTSSNSNAAGGINGAGTGGNNSLVSSPVANDDLGRREFERNGAAASKSGTSGFQPSSSFSADTSTQQQDRDGASQQQQASAKTNGSSGGKERRRDQPCAACGKPMSGQFVRALGTVYHLDCFRCKDCGKGVASKFFPATDDMIDNNGEQTGQLFALCETDYFRRLNLICAKCGGALRGSYITALGMKFHVEHFTCSVCPTVFGPQDSYYEHDGKVFCHFHYSTRFAIPCTGCRTAILKQFVEINRNNVDEHWHPECYMIHKFWNIKLVPTGMTPHEGNVAIEPTANRSEPNPSNSGVAPTTSASADAAPTADALELEAKETPVSLKQKQRLMEERVYRIWTVLSAFEESSAACISEMLKDVSSGRYLGGVRMAEKFILHVEVLFSAIDDLEAEFRKAQVKGISHIREARMLCKKIVNFFSLLSHTQETGARRMGITQELLSLVTGMAHYLKILIRIALSGALKLDREHGNADAIVAFLDQLASLAKEGTRPDQKENGPDGRALDGSDANSAPATYGYKSLPRSTTTSSSSRLAAESGIDIATDLCVGCGQTVEEECLRLGINTRWHSSCFRCHTCQRPTTSWTPKKIPAVPAAGAGGATGAAPTGADSSAAKAAVAAQTSVEGAPPALPPADFSVESVRKPYDPTIPGGSSRPTTSHTPYCPTCATPAARKGLETVSRLEQYAFLLRVALNRLYTLLKKRGVVPASPPAIASATLAPEDGYRQGAQYTQPMQGTQPGLQQQPTQQYLPHQQQQNQQQGQGDDASLRDSSDMKRMRSSNLDRKLSTKAKVPHISTVVGSPSGRKTDTQAMSPVEPSQMQQQRSQQPLRRSPSPQRPPRAQQPPGQASRELSPNAGDASQQTRQPGSIIPIRPAFARHNTDVRIREDGPVRQQTSADEEAKRRLGVSYTGPGSPGYGGGNLGGVGHGGSDADGITLADIPQLLEVEQAREQHRMPANHGRRSFAELSALELFIVKHMAVMVLQQSALRDLAPLDDLIEFIETRKNTFWGKLFKGGKDKKEIKKKGVFGIPLEILVERSGADSALGASANHLRVPSFVDDIISTMKQMDVSVEGIFRKNGNIRRLKDLTEALDRDSTQVNLFEDNPVQLAALLKKFLRELPDPLMTFKLHKLFVSSQMLEPESERMRILHMVTVLLPKAHRDTLEILFVFLKWVASFSHIDEETGSKMDLSNLATVLAPNILYSKGPNPAKDETFLANRAVLSILENQESFWTVPPELEAVLQDREFINQSADMTSRDILKRCEKHALNQKQSVNRMRPEFNAAGPGGPQGKQPPLRQQTMPPMPHQAGPQAPSSSQPPLSSAHLPPPSQQSQQQRPYGNPEMPSSYSPIASRN